MKSIFELTIVRRYSFRGVSCYERVIFPNVERSEEHISLMTNDGKNDDVFCYILRELPIGKLCQDEECLTERVYLSNGQKMNERLFSSVNNEGEFRGRTKDQLHCKEGELVQMLALANNKIAWGIVCAVPRDDMWVSKHYPNKGMPHHLDASDDSYIILEGVNTLKGMTKEQYMNYHIHISSLRVFPMNNKQGNNEQKVEK